MTKAILCVDDEKIILDSLRSQLNRCFGKEYLCEIAMHAEEALEIIEDLQEDKIKTLIIVSDWLMPDIKGDKFLVQVHEKYPQIIKMLLTGQADTDAIENAKANANLYACLSKPWNEEDLVNVIRNALEEVNE